MSERGMTLHDLAPADARRIRDEAVSQMRAAEMVAYAVTDPDYFYALVDFPIPNVGPSYVWTGAWKVPAHAEQIPPLLRIGTSPASSEEIAQLRYRMGITSQRSPLPPQIEGDRIVVRLTSERGRRFAQFIDGPSYVLVVATATVPDLLTVARLHDPTPLIDRWVQLGGDIPETR